MQYLLNASVIWLISLLAFELFFRRETLHWLNRAYLLGTLLLGLLLPLWHSQHTGAVVLDAMPGYVQQAIAAPGTVLHAPVLQQAIAMPSVNWLFILYGCGLLVSLTLLMRTIVACSRLQQGSTRSRYNGYTLIETGKQHGPFSFFNFVFLSSAAQYSSEELTLVLRHELRHARLLHSVDVLLLQLLKTVLWFHPLLYWYDKRLRMVHEYEADVVGRENVAGYGQFLIEQALLQPAPKLTSALNHSPIKNRIMMLMRNKISRKGLAKYLLVLPMLAFFIAACTQSQPQLPGKKVIGNKVYFKGNEFDIATSKVLGKEAITVMVDSGTDVRVLDSVPYKMNGENIYNPAQLSQQPVYKGPDSSAAAYILAQIQNSLTALDDGEYTISINDVVLDKAGHIAYYQYAGIKQSIPIPISFKEDDTAYPHDRSIKATIAKSVNEKDREEALIMLKAYNSVMDKANKELETRYGAINQKVVELLNDPQIHFTPAIRNKYPVPTYLDEQFNCYTTNMIRVRNHQVKILNSEYPSKIVRYVP